MQVNRRVEIRSQRCLFDDFFKIDELTIAHEQTDGTMSPDQRRLIFERGDAVAVLLFNPDTRSVVLVEQFRAPVLAGRRRDDPATADGWINELVAGMIGPGETAAQAAARETLEETGYRIKEPELIGSVSSSPGGSSERIFLYFAEVSETVRFGKGGGTNHEDISVVQIPVDELFGRLTRRQIEDSKLVIAAYWLAARLAAKNDH